MDFTSSTRADENRIRWIGIVAYSFVVPRQPSKVMRRKRIGYSGRINACHITE